MRCSRFILAMMLFGMSALIAAAETTPLLVDDFDQDAIGTIPAGWRLARTVSGTSAIVVEGTPAGNKWVDLHDDNAPGTTLNNTLSRTFAPVTATTGSGRVTAEFDVKLSQIAAGFGTRLTNGGVATSGQNWATALLFEGNIAYAPGATAGKLSYQSTTLAYTLSPMMQTYSPDTWYTVRVEADVSRKLHKIFFGPRGTSLTEITLTGGVPFIKTTAGGQVDQIGGISFYTSIKDGDATGDLMIDNVNIYVDEPEQPTVAHSIAEARLLQRGTKASLTNKIVTAGTAGDVFYIEDDTPGVERAAGIRVRALGTVVNEGDRIDVVGRIQQTSEGIASDHAGEREISAEQVSVRSSGDPVPRPLHVRHSDIGGGWFGPMELVPEGLEPAIKGVWPFNAWGNAGVTSYVPEENRMYPLVNTGLPVTVTGKVVETTVYDPPGTNYDFYIDDGSLMNDGWFAAPTFADEVFHPRGLRVRVTDPAIISGVAPLHYGDVVSVTGIAGAISCSGLGRSSIRNVRVIRPRKPEDIEVVQRQERYVKFDLQGNCLVRGKYFFPIGIFTYYWDSLTRPEILSQGFNTITSSINDGITPAHLSQLQSDGIMVLPYMADMEYYDAWLAAKDHPAILGWYLLDEPEGNGVTPRATPAQQRAEYERLRAADPTHPIGTAHYLWNALYDYRFAEDFTKSDVYPIHKAPIVNVAIHIDRVHQVHGDGYPVWPFIQCFASANEGYDAPSPAEERCMVYLALAHRSKGIFFFSYYPSLTETWAEVKQLVTEMKQLAPFYCLPSSEPTLGSSNASIHTRLIRIGDSGLIITVNPTGEARSATFTIPTPPPDSLTLPVEGGTIPVTGGSFAASFEALGVHVYQWGPTPVIP